MVKIVCKIINLSLPNLACFAPWRESIPAFEYFRLLENLREPRKLLNIVVQTVYRVRDVGVLGGKEEFMIPLKNFALVAVNNKYDP